eukprot:c23255_g1_i2 orf=529-1293(-)
MEVLQTLSEPFYALHALMFFSYFMFRHAATTTSSLLFRDHLFHREVQTCLSLAVLLCLKWRRSQSFEAMLGESLFYGKAVLMLLATLLDRRLAAWYMLCFAVIFLLFQQPPFKGLGNVVQMSPLQLENHLSEGNSARCWLIEFRAIWSPQCIRAGRVFANLSSRYSTEDLYFGSVDIGRFPKAGEAFGIPLGVQLEEVPSYVMFQNGNEVSRLPNTGNEDGKKFANPLSESVIANYFDLDRRLIFDLEKSLLKK